MAQNGDDSNIFPLKNRAQNYYKFFFKQILKDIN